MREKHKLEINLTTFQEACNMLDLNYFEQVENHFKYNNYFLQFLSLFID